MALGMGGVGKYHSSLLQALSEALIAQGREQGDNDMPAKRATKIVVEAMATRISAALVPEKKVVAELVARRRPEAVRRSLKSECARINRRMTRPQSMSPS